MRTANLRLRSFTVTCAHRVTAGMPSTVIASAITTTHGWQGAWILQEPCGCAHFYRTEEDCDADRPGLSEKSRAKAQRALASGGAESRPRLLN